MLNLRAAIPIEFPEINPVYEHWGKILEEDGAYAGCIFLSRAPGGEVYGFNWECKSNDKNGAAMIFQAMRKQVKEWNGTGEMWVHTAPGEPLPELYKKKGFKAKVILFKGVI